MIYYRPFRNSDPPALAEIWQAQPPQHRLAQPMTASVLEDFVFSKSYFDRHGLIVAVDGAHPIGFVHASFAADDSHGRVDRERGIISRLMVSPRPNRNSIASELLSAGEDYLRKAGAKEAFVGNLDGRGPFYLGLYGGAQLPGVVAADTESVAFFRASGYQQTGERRIVQRSLTGFRPPYDRDQVRLRRQHDLVAHEDPVARTWWEATNTSILHRMLFELHSKCGGPPIATAMIWDLGHLGESWGVRTAGIEDVSASSPAWLDGCVVMLLAEILKWLQSQGTTLAEAVVNVESPLNFILDTLGFAEVDKGYILRKALVAS